MLFRTESPSLARQACIASGDVEHAFQILRCICTTTCEMSKNITAHMISHVVSTRRSVRRATLRPAHDVEIRLGRAVCACTGALQLREHTALIGAQTTLGHLLSNCAHRTQVRSGTCCCMQIRIDARRRRLRDKLLLRGVVVTKIWSIHRYAMRRFVTAFRTNHVPRR